MSLQITELGSPGVAKVYQLTIGNKKTMYQYLEWVSLQYNYRLCQIGLLVHNIMFLYLSVYNYALHNIGNFVSSMLVIQLLAIKWNLEYLHYILQYQ